MTVAAIIFPALLTVAGLIFAMKVINREQKRELSAEELAVFETEINSRNIKGIVDAQIQHQMGNGPEPIAILARKGN